MALTSEQLAKAAKLNHLKSLAARTKAVTDNLQTQIDTLDSGAIKSVKVNGTALTPTEGAVNITLAVEKKQTANTGYAASYSIKANGAALSPDIDIPKDFLVKSATLETSTSENYSAVGCSAAGKKFIDFVVNTVDNDETASHIYLPVEDLVDVYTAGNGLAVANNEFSLVIDGSLQNGLKVDANGLGLGLAAGATTTYVAATGTYVTGTTYYTDNTGATAVNTESFEDGVTDVSSYFVAQAVAAKNGAMLGTDKAKLDGISDQSNRTTVTTEKAGTIEIDGTTKVIVEFATDAEVAEMLDTELPAPSSGSGE